MKYWREVLLGLVLGVIINIAYIAAISGNTTNKQNDIEALISKENAMCPILTNLSVRFMDFRQREVPIETVRESLLTQTNGDIEIESLINSVLEGAYEHDIQGTEEDKMTSIIEYSNLVGSLCNEFFGDLEGK